MDRSEDPGGRGHYYWNRALEDGAPFRGHGYPLLTDTEFEDNTYKVYDPIVRVFDLTNPEHVVEYTNALDEILNKVAKTIVHKPDIIDGKFTVLLVWARVALELHPSKKDFLHKF